MHLAVAGNIGSGKTTLTTLLAKHYRYTPHFEEVDNNPYLNDFYKDMTRWSFNLQVYFLRSRFSQLIEMKKKGKPIIQDRTIYEDANIFAPNLQAMGLMTTRDFENYLSLFELMEEFVTPPICSCTCAHPCPLWWLKFRSEVGTTRRPSDSTTSTV